MALRLPRVPALFKRRYILLLIIVIIVGLGAYWFHFKDNNKKETTPLPDPVPTRSEYLQIESKAMNDSLGKKDYTTAVNTLLLGVHDAIGLGKLKDANDLFKNSLSQIPDSAVPWYVYSARADLAHRMNDKSLEKQSLEKAIQKASAPKSDASPEQINGMNQKLAGLG